MVRSLVGSDPLEGLGDVLAGVDRRHLRLILAALAHAGGSHQHVDLVVDDGRASLHQLPALIGWTESRGAAA